MSKDPKDFTPNDVDAIEKVLTQNLKLSQDLEAKGIPPDDVRLLCTFAKIGLRQVDR